MFNSNEPIKVSNLEKLANQWLLNGANFDEYGK